MAGTIVNNPVVQFFDNNGNPLAGGKITTYLSNTTTPASTWQNEGLSVLNTNPIILNSRGEATIWLTPDIQYTFVLTDANDNLIQTVNDIYGGFQPVNGIDAAQVSYTPAGTGAVETTVEKKLIESVSILDYIPIAEHAAIKAGTSTYDCYPAIMNAINSVTYGTGFYISGPAVYFPSGVYRVSQTIQLKRSVHLWGDGSGLPSTSTATLLFGAGVTGFIIHRFNTIGAGIESPPTTAGDASIISGLRLIGTAGAADAFGGHGIWLRARAIVRDIYVQGFVGKGIQVVATAGGGPSVEGNANNFVIDVGRVQNCGSDGLFIDGADVNAGIVTALDCSSNAGWGIYDSSFLGNTFVGCHVDGNTLGSYKTDDPNARSVFVGCYSEGGWPASSIVFPSIVLGGLHGAGFIGSEPESSFINGRQTPTRTLSRDLILGTPGRKVEQWRGFGDQNNCVEAWFYNSEATPSFCAQLNTAHTVWSWQNGFSPTAWIWFNRAAFASGGTSYSPLTLPFKSSWNAGDESRFDFDSANNGSRIATRYSGINWGLRLYPVKSDLTKGVDIDTSGNTTPLSDNVQNLGSASFRWGTVFAGTGAINTSDARAKEQDRPLSEKEKAVAVKVKSLLKAFKYKEAVKTKGTKARIHFGIYAQELKSAFESEGLVAEDYGVLCYDEWDESPEIYTDVLDGEGNPTGEKELAQAYRSSGGVYGVRYEELLAFILAAL